MLLHLTCPPTIISNSCQLLIDGLDILLHFHQWRIEETITRAPRHGFPGELLEISVQPIRLLCMCVNTFAMCGEVLSHSPQIIIMRSQHWDNKFTKAMHVTIPRPHESLVRLTQLAISNIAFMQSMSYSCHVVKGGVHCGTHFIMNLLMLRHSMIYFIGKDHQFTTALLYDLYHLM